MHTQNSALRRIEYRRGQHRTENAAVGNGEGAAFQIVVSQGTGPGLCAEIDDALLNAGKIELIRIAQYRHNQAALGADRNANVIVAVIDNIVIVDGSIDGRKAL